MWRKTIIQGMSAVEREHRAAARGAALLSEQSKIEPSILHDAAVTRLDVRHGITNLEDTYIVRLFAVFEEALRDIWTNAFGKSTNPRTYDLIQACGARQHVKHNDLTNAHLVPDYRNSVVHGGDAARVSLQEARSFLCTLFGWMPKQW